MITILCSVYNASEYLDQYLEYVNKQTLKNFEIFFVDANSTDNSVKKILSYHFREGISRNVLTANSRIGIYEAWNVAIQNSSHDYVMNFNCDDRLYPTALQTYATYASLNPDADVIYSDSFISNTSDHVPHSWYNWADANVKENLLRGCCVGPYPLLKKSTIVEAGMFNPEFTISGDYEMWCRLNSLGKTFLKIDEIVGVYFNNPKGASTADDPERHARHCEQDSKIRTTYA